MRLLPDGRAGAPILLDEPGDEATGLADYALLERAGERWLVAAIYEEAVPLTPSATGTPSG